MGFRLILPALLFSGLAQALISPPLNWTLLHVVSWVPALWVFSNLSGRKAFLAGWLVGTSANLAIFYWLTLTAHNFLGIPVLATPFVLLGFSAWVGLHVGVFAWGFKRICRIASGAWPFAIAAWFVALEFLIPQLFTYYQGVAWYQQPYIFLISSFTGVSGMSFLVILCNALLLQGIEVVRTGEESRSTVIINVLIFSFLLLMSIAYSTQRLADIESAETGATPIEIAVIQPDYSVDRRETLQRQPPGSFARDLVSLSQEVAGSKLGEIDVFVWPENALPKPPWEERNHQVIDFTLQNKTEIWTGSLFQDSLKITTGVHRNAAYRIDSNGNIDKRYDKTLLIPFGEYVPFKGILPGLERVSLPGNFEAGDGIKIFSSELANFSFLICYEAIKSTYIKKAVQDGADLLVNISGDVRSGNHSEQSQYLMLTAVQAAQFGVPLIRSTSTGISAFVDSRGQITSQIDVFERGGLVQSVRPLQVPSFYTRYGDWFAWICIGVSIFLFAASGSIKLLCGKRVVHG